MISHLTFWFSLEDFTLYFLLRIELKAQKQLAKQEIISKVDIFSSLNQVRSETTAMFLIVMLF